MSLIDDLMAYGRDAAIAVAADPAWVLALTERARPLVEEGLDGGWKVAAETALDVLDAQASTVAHLGAAGLVGLTASWAAQGVGAAQEAYLRHHANIDELLAAADANDGAALAAGSGPTWADVLGVLEAIAGALPALIPILLAAASYV